MSSWHLRVSGQCYAPNTGYGLPCKCTDTLGTWVMIVLFMPLHLVHLALSPVTISPLAGFVLTLTHLLVVAIVTASAKSWKNCIALELKEHRYLRTGAFAPLVVLLSAFFPRVHFALQQRQWKAQLRVSLPRRVLVKVSHTTRGILSWNCYFTSKFAVSFHSLLVKLTWLRSHNLVILLLTNSATRKVFTILHDATLGTISR